MSINAQDAPALPNFRDVPAGVDAPALPNFRDVPAECVVLGEEEEGSICGGGGPVMGNQVLGRHLILERSAGVVAVQSEY
ncbi:hypothetical protein [Nostoc sp.]|uniref:hypothetical protein n=1 Tax=Nostoc sp. TaxID=1180 RepID=UPI002FF4DAF3